MDDQETIVIRDPLPADKNFILSTWLKGQYFGNSFYTQMPEDMYYREYSKHIIEIMSRDGVEIRIACSAQDSSWIVGFSVFKGDTLHWIHVKRDYREKGIGTILLHNAPITTVTAITKIGLAILQNKGLIFNPGDMPCQMKKLKQSFVKT